MKANYFVIPLATILTAFFGFGVDYFNLADFAHIGAFIGAICGLGGVRDFPRLLRLAVE